MKKIICKTKYLIYTIHTMITAISNNPDTSFHGKRLIIKRITPQKPVKTLTQNYDEFCTSIGILGTHLKNKPLDLFNNAKLLGKTLSLGFQINMKFMFSNKVS